MAINVWTNSRDVPGVVCADARLSAPSQSSWPFARRRITTTDQLFGQAGWDIGFNFTDITDLKNKLTKLHLPDYLPDGDRTIKRGEIQRLAIHAHGSLGTIYINGQRNPATLSAKTVNTNHSCLYEIGLMTPDNKSNPAVILFVGCIAGTGKDGTNLLIALSNLWPNRKVVAFASLGFAHGGEMKRSGESCTEPGMRDTNALYAGEANDNAGKYWKDLKTWPWASETSPRAKVALNGAIIQGAQW